MKLWINLITGKVQTNLVYEGDRQTAFRLQEEWLYEYFNIIIKNNKT